MEGDFLKVGRDKDSLEKVEKKALKSGESDSDLSYDSWDDLKTGKDNKEIETFDDLKSAYAADGIETFDDLKDAYASGPKSLEDAYGVKTVDLKKKQQQKIDDKKLKSVRQQIDVAHNKSEDKRGDGNEYVGVKKNSDGTYDYSKAAIFRSGNQDLQNGDNDAEKEKKPEKLFRAFTMHPDELSIEKFRETLTPQNVNEDDPTKVNDGNELGVYMSTSEQMVKTGYAHFGGNIKGLKVRVPEYSSAGGGKDRFIKLPSCGVIFEIDTKNLNIREPEISQELAGHYNNGMPGEEWIADSISADKYRVKKLTLVTGPHIPEFSVDVDYSNENGLQEAIDFIKEKFNQKKQEAEEFRIFLESLSEKDRRKTSSWIKKEWGKYKDKLANQFEREDEMELHEKAQKIEWLDISPSQDAEMFLVACGLKPATEIDVYRYQDGRDRSALIKTARDIGLSIQEKDIAPHKNQNMEGTFVIAKDIKILKRLMQVEANADHREYGRLMGFPESAVDALMNDDLLPDEEYPDMNNIVFHFKLSKEHWKEEIEVMKQWSDILQKYMPDTYNDLLGNH